MKKAFVLTKECVACGCCVSTCPKGAITLERGIFARISNILCVGCGLCAKICPASVITLEVPHES